MIISTIDNKEAKKEKPFPKLMRCGGNGQIVLFTDREVGIVMDAGISANTLYKKYNDWVMDVFTDFKGSITLSNEV